MILYILENEEVKENASQQMSEHEQGKIFTFLFSKIVLFSLLVI